MGKADGLTQPTPLFESFGGQAEERQENYKKFLQIFNENEELPFEDSESPQGSKEFVNQLIKEKGLFLPKRRGRPKK